MIYQIKDEAPTIANDAFIAANATIIGQVKIEAEASIWFGAVLRGDAGLIKIGKGSNVQDNSVIHVNERADTVIDEYVTIGHGVIAEGCHIQSDCLIGMGATLLSGSVIGKGSLIAAGCVVREHQIVPEGVLVAGVPAKVIRPLTAQDQQRIRESAKHYIERRLDYLNQLYQR